MPFKISTLKNAIPTKSYSLVMLHLLNTKYKSCTPQCQPSNWFMLFKFNPTQYMSARHGYSTMGGIGYGGRD